MLKTDRAGTAVCKRYAHFTDFTDSSGRGCLGKGFDTEFNENSVAVSKGLAEEYRKVSEKYGLAFLNAADYAQPGAADREHLDEEGHQRLAEAVLHVIKNIIDKKINKSY